MNLSLESAQAIIVLLVDRAPKNHAELAGAQAAIETLSAALKELAELKSKNTPPDGTPLTA